VQGEKVGFAFCGLLQVKKAEGLAREIADNNSYVVLFATPSRCATY
jgi:hypothetical protein